MEQLPTNEEIEELMKQMPSNDPTECKLPQKCNCYGCAQQEKLEEGWYNEF